MGVLQRTCVIIKPEALERDLMGRILQKFEDAGLEIERLETFKVTRDLAGKHYLYDNHWFKRVGEKALTQFKLRRMKIGVYLRTDNPVRIGKMIYKWSIDSLSGKKVVAAVLSGPHAIGRVVQLVGTTEPIMAERGTIRGDWCTDSVIYSNIQKRAIVNLVHRSFDEAEAKREREVWFG